MKQGIKTYAVFAALILVVVSMALAGCSKAEPESEPEEPSAGMPNPWSEVKTSEEAAEGAGVEIFECAGIKTSLGMTEPTVYRYMDGLVEAEFPIAAVDMNIRKGTDAVTDVAEGDISGDYNEYKYTWKQDVDDMEVTCSGNRKGESTKTLWKRDGYYYSILAFGAGGDDDFGLSEEDVQALVSEIE